MLRRLALLPLLALFACSSSTESTPAADTGSVSVIEGGTDTGADLGTPDVPSCSSCARPRSAPSLG
ncbi:MAG: hypothetical protein IPJ34_33295 [Myxococcales bacterium]|nr:hypothetical protein [Myxococcales bacterium]